MGDVVREVTELARDGVSEITLLGQNVNSYGRDLGAGQWAPQFADLLRAVDAVDGIERVRYTSPHPKDLRAETAVAMAECASVCEHLHLPVQSGSDHVLARMRRGYTASRYLEKLAMARAAIDDLAVTTDIIVGFPGETEADFAATLELVDAAQYDAAYTFVFSPRPGTAAAGMEADFVPEAVARSACSASPRSSSATPSRGTRRASDGSKRSWWRVPRRRTQPWRRGGPARTSWSTSSASSRPGPRRGWRSAGARRTGSRDPSSRWSTGPVPRGTRIPVTAG